MAVKVITDSVADLSSQIAEELGITVVPLHVRFGDEVYRDGVDITTERFYDELVHSEVLPTTSVPSPGDFVEAYDKVAEETDEILVVVISSKLSGTYEVASQSIGLMKKKCRVEVVDSRMAIMAEGLLAISAAKAAGAGASLDKVLDVTRSNIGRIDLRVALDTLEYLKRGGRIGKAQALLGAVLDVKPIVTIKEGVLEPAGRTRSRPKVIEYLYNFVMEYSRIEEMAIEEATTPDDADMLAERLDSKFPKERIYRAKPSPVIGTNTGPGLLGVAVLGDKE